MRPLEYTLENGPDFDYTELHEEGEMLLSTLFIFKEKSKSDLDIFYEITISYRAWKVGDLKELDPSLEKIESRVNITKIEIWMGDDSKPCKIIDENSGGIPDHYQMTFVPLIWEYIGS